VSVFEDGVASRSVEEAGPHGGGFSRRIGWGRRPALVVVDLVRAYTDPAGPFALPDPEPAVAAVADLVRAARTGAHPVVWTDVRYAADLVDGGHFVRKVPALAAFAEGAPGGWGDLVLEPADGEPVVHKQYASAFFGTSLAATLHAAGVDTVVFGGVSTSGCIRASATEALNHGFRPMVVRQACADRSAALHENNLTDLDAKYADVVELVDAAARLSRRQG
jgi:maleamate amidohydrolase